MATHRPVPMSPGRGHNLSPWLALRAVPPPLPQVRSAMLWGDPSVSRFAVRTAAAAIDSGVTVAVIDATLAFDVTTIAAYARARRVPPEHFLRRIHIARAFTCYQVATLLCERLDPLLDTQRVGLVVLLGPCTTFFDENVPFKDAFLLFQRVLKKLAALRRHGPLLLIAQALGGYRTRRLLFVRALAKMAELGVRVSIVEGRRHIQVVKPRDFRANRGGLQSR